MDSHNITLFANMPRVDMFAIENLNRETSLEDFDATLDFIDAQFIELENLDKQKRNIIIYGSSENVEVALEALSQTMKNIWESIKAAFLKLLSWLGLDTYFTAWFTTTGRRLAEMEKLIRTKERFYTKVDASKFKNHEIVGFEYSKYIKLLDVLNRITQKINNVCTGAVVYENINIETTFCPDICSLGFVVRENELFEPPAIEIDKKSFDRLGWNPSLVHSTTVRMHSLLTHTVNTDRISSSLKAILESSVRMCDQNLNPSTESDADQLAIAKKRLANIRKLRKICAWDMTYTSVMYRQWSTMVNRFDIAVI